MGEKRRPLLDRLINFLKKQAVRALVEQIKKRLRGLIKAVVLGLIGYTLVIAGLLFLWLGITKYLQFLLPPWLSWIISGVILFLIGAALLAFSYSKVKP